MVAGTGMCPAAAGGGASGKNHAFCPRRAGPGRRPDPALQQWQEPGSSASSTMLILPAMWTRLWTFLDWCFFGPASLGPGRGARLLRGMRYPYAVARDLSRGDINLRAMGLVYTTLLSLIPLAAFSFAILEIFGARRDLAPVVYELFSALGP